MSEAQFALRDLAQPDVNLQWYEAVAVTLAMAEHWPAGARAVVPFEGFTITGGGSVRTVPHVTPSVDPTRELGIALQSLLVDPGAPRDLRDLAQTAAQSAPGTAPTAMLQALAYFERPDRARVLLFLAQRVVPELPEVDVEAELRRLEARARDRAERSKPPSAVQRALAWLKANWRQWKPAFVVLVVAAVLGGAVWAFETRPGLRAGLAGVNATVRAQFAKAVRWIRPAPAQQAPAAEEAAGTGEAAGGARDRRAARQGSAASSAGAGSTSAAAGPGGQGVPAGGASPGGPGSRAAGAPADTPDDDPVPPLAVRDVQPYVPAAGATGAPGAAGASGGEAGGVVVEGFGTVYRASDPGVEPARLERRYLPTAPPEGVPAAQTGIFQLVVDEKGQVLQVQLLSPGNRYQERMLLAAAKAWRFTPATRNGVPVKFLSQVQVTW